MVVASAGEIAGAIAVAVGLEDEVLGFQMFFAGGHSDVDDVVHDDEAAEVRAGSDGEGASLVGGQRCEVLADLQIV